MTDESRAADLMAQALLHVVTSLVVELDRKKLIDLADVVATVQKMGVAHRSHGQRELSAAVHILSEHLLRAVV